MSKDLALINAKYLLLSLKTSMEYFANDIEKRLPGIKNAAQFERHYIKEIDKTLEKINAALEI